MVANTNINMNFNSEFSNTHSASESPDDDQQLYSNLELIKLKINYVMRDLIAERTVFQYGTQEYSVLSRVIKCCEELMLGKIISGNPREEKLVEIKYTINIISKNSNEKRVTNKLLRLSKYECGNLNISPYVTYLIELANELENKRSLKTEFSDDSYPNINIDKSYLHSLTYSFAARPRIATPVVSFNPYLERKKDFFSLVINRKLELSHRHPSYKLSVQDLYEEAMNLNIHRDNWGLFIDSKFGL